MTISSYHDKSHLGKDYHLLPHIGLPIYSAWKAFHRGWFYQHQYFLSQRCAVGHSSSYIYSIHGSLLCIGR